MGEEERPNNSTAEGKGSVLFCRERIILFGKLRKQGDMLDPELFAFEPQAASEERRVCPSGKGFS